jgi:hypothetical protein
MIRIAPIFALLTACASTDWVAEANGVRLGVHGAPSVRNDGYTLRLRFDVGGAHESIQRLAATDGWEGWETHRQPMWISDFQRMRVAEPDGFEHRDHRINTVWPGRTEGAPWLTLPGIFKGVCLISGFLGIDGEPLMNATYFRWGGKQGGRVAETHGDGLTYEIHWWSRGHALNPARGRATLQLTYGHEVLREWKEEADNQQD